MSRNLITVPELHEEDGEVALFDLRWKLGDPGAGRRAYLEAHIPGAVFVDLETHLTGDGPGRHPLPDPDRFTQTLGSLGVGSHSDVVAYDDSGGSIAARMWWMLTAIGHRGTMRVLDGGWQAWVDSGFEAEEGEVLPATNTYPRAVGDWRGVMNRDEVAASPVHLHLDARSPDRYRGEEEIPVDARSGHVPGAVNTPWEGNLDRSGHFKDPTELRRRYEALGADRRPVVISCGSGVTACHLALAMDIAGLIRPSLYVGSFSDWTASDLPVASGTNPG